MQINFCISFFCSQGLTQQQKLFLINIKCFFMIMIVQLCFFWHGYCFFVPAILRRKQTYECGVDHYVRPPNNNQERTYAPIHYFPSIVLNPVIVWNAFTFPLKFSLKKHTLKFFNLLTGFEFF